MTLYWLVKLIHILSGAVLFGTGMGIAFFMVWANRSRDASTIAPVARIVVVADMIFTATAVVVQPLSGLWLIQIQGYSLSEPWLVAAYGLYAITGLFWLPVVWIQVRLARLAEEAASQGTRLSATYGRLYRIWFAMGFPAFVAVIGIYGLMVARPVF
ncbi:DUF2269 family protein [Brevundimonas subvibrioides]|uniref:DUF2269 family protein n=1 Tax=Brevundimonas subvibrioides TaxID=74313 RepID=UPI0022B404FD|nr:DUF2269 domain-containing protein [Brevundimonas subvibrioides]